MSGESKVDAFDAFAKRMHDDVVARARSELDTFDRISAKSAEALLAEIAALRAKLDETEAALREFCEHVRADVLLNLSTPSARWKRLLNQGGLWRDPEPKEESDGEG